MLGIQVTRREDGETATKAHRDLNSGGFQVL